MGIQEWARHSIPYKVSKTIIGYLVDNDWGYCPDCWADIEGDVDIIFEGDVSQEEITCCVCGTTILGEED